MASEGWVVAHFTFSSRVCPTKLQGDHGKSALQECAPRSIEAHLGAGLTFAVLWVFLWTAVLAPRRTG